PMPWRAPCSLQTWTAQAIQAITRSSPMTLPTTSHGFRAQLRSRSATPTARTVPPAAVPKEGVSSIELGGFFSHLGTSPATPLEPVRSHSGGRAPGVKDTPLVHPEIPAHGQIPGNARRRDSGGRIHAGPRGEFSGSRYALPAPCRLFACHARNVPGGSTPLAILWLRRPRQNRRSNQRIGSQEPIRIGPPENLRPLTHTTFLLHREPIDRPQRKTNRTD